MNQTLTAVDGLIAGHWTAEPATTGTTAVLFPRGAVASVVVPGSASGTRELEVLDPRHLTGRVHGFCLSGGSAFGLSAADGVMAVLAERGIGYVTPAAVVPIVPAAILYDLDQGDTRPDATSGGSAARAAASTPLAEGRVGAGAGATVAKLDGVGVPGGFGGWAETRGAYTVAAGVAVNALGAIRDPESGRWVAGHPAPIANPTPGSNTSLAVVATDAPLDKGGAAVLARMASAGMARAIWPAYSPFDGDTIFAASTGAGPVISARELAVLGHAAARCLATAIVRAVEVR